MDTKTRPKINQHKKGDAISILNELADAIKLKIQTSPEHWDALFEEYKKDSLAFADSIYRSFLVPAFVHNNADRTSERNLFSRIMKLQAGVLNIALNRDFSQWKTHFSDLYETFQNYELNGFEDSNLLFNAYCIQKYYQHKIKACRFKDFFNQEKDDYENFRTTYIHDGLTIIENDPDHLVILGQLLSFSRKEQDAAKKNDEAMAKVIMKVNTHYFRKGVFRCLGCMQAYPIEMLQQQLPSCLCRIIAALVVSEEPPENIKNIILHWLSSIG